MLNTILKELNTNGNICEILGKNFEYTIRQRKIIEDEYDSQFDDYRDNDEEERTKHINKELSKSTIHKKLQKLNLNDVLINFDAMSLYPSSMWYKNEIYCKIESHLNITYVVAFIYQTFNPGGNESAILKIKDYNLPDLIFQHLPVREKLENIE